MEPVPTHSVGTVNPTELQHLAMQQLMENNQVAMQIRIEKTMAPMMEMLQTLKADSVKKEDLKTFKNEVREEMKAMIDATFVKESAANRQAGKGVDPLVTRDPWTEGQAWNAWNAHLSSTASSSGSATTGQGDTSQALRGKMAPTR